MIVVSDASALINLARIGELGLLRQLYGEIVIPQAVWQEVVVEGAGQPGADAVGKASWIRAKEVTNEHLVRALRQDLDAGEAEAIALVLELKAHLLIAIRPSDGRSSRGAVPGADRCAHRGQARWLDWRS